MITQEQLKARYTYIPSTGLFVSNIKTNKHNVGDFVGHINSKGYVVIKCYKQTYKAHRLAFLYMTGNFPLNDVDHINGNKSDNRWENIRDVSKCINLQNRKGPASNSKLKLLGVNKQGTKYKAQICLFGKKKHLGMFSSPEEAHKVYVEYKEKYAS